MKELSPALSTDGSVFLQRKPRKRYRDRCADLESQASTSVATSRANTPCPSQVRAPLFPDELYGADDFVLLSHDEEDTSSPGARSPQPGFARPHPYVRSMARGATPELPAFDESVASEAAASVPPPVEVSSDSETESETSADSSASTDSDAQSRALRSRSGSVFSERSRVSSPATTTVPTSSVDDDKADPFLAAPLRALADGQHARPSVNVAMLARVSAVSVGATLCGVLLAQQTSEVWQPPATRLLASTQQKLGEYVINPVSDTLTRGAAWLARYGYHPAPTPLPYDPVADWQEMAVRFRRLNHVVEAAGLGALPHGDGRP